MLLLKLLFLNTRKLKLLNNLIKNLLHFRRIFLNSWHNVQKCLQNIHCSNKNILINYIDKSKQSININQSKSNLLIHYLLNTTNYQKPLTLFVIHLLNLLMILLNLSMTLLKLMILLNLLTMKIIVQIWHFSIILLINIHKMVSKFLDKFKVNLAIYILKGYQLKLNKNILEIR